MRIISKEGQDELDKKVLKSRALNLSLCFTHSYLCVSGSLRTRHGLAENHR